MVALGDVPSFLDSDSGIKIMQENSTFVELVPRSAVWVPYGYAVIPVNMPGGVECSEKKDTEDPYVSMTWTVAYFAKELRNAVPEKVWSAIETWNEAHLTRMTSLPVWEARAELWHAFKEHCKA